MNNFFFYLKLNFKKLKCRKTTVYFSFILCYLINTYLFLIYFFRAIIFFLKKEQIFQIFFRLFYFYFTTNLLTLYFLNKNKEVLKKFLFISYFSLRIFSKLLSKIYYNFYDLTFVLKSNKTLILLLKILKNEQLFSLNSFIDLLAVDTLLVNKRFLLFYNFLSIKNNARINLLVYLKDFEKIYSISPLYSSALWLEREVWDLSGIYFLNHKDLRRLLTDYGFQGHPLRRDFPLTGFFELYYNYSFKKIIYEPVSLAQKYRNFCFENKWLNT